MDIERSNLIVGLRWKNSEHKKYWAVVPRNLASAARRVLCYSSAIGFGGTEVHCVVTTCVLRISFPNGLLVSQQTCGGRS